MDPFYRWIEDGDLSTWLKESESVFAFPGVLTIHVIGMGFLAGTSLVIALRLLGLVPELPVRALEKLIPLCWIAFALSLASGVLLVIAYPTKAFTNPLFYVKLGAIAAGLAVLVAIRRTILAENPSPAWTSVAQKLAVASLVLWVGTITAGRLLAYTYTRLLVSF